MNRWIFRLMFWFRKASFKDILLAESQNQLWLLEPTEGDDDKHESEESDDGECEPDKDDDEYVPEGFVSVKDHDFGHLSAKDQAYEYQLEEDQPEEEETYEYLSGKDKAFENLPLVDQLSNL